jgi:hypothetical protein
MGVDVYDRFGLHSRKMSNLYATAGKARLTRRRERTEILTRRQSGKSMLNLRIQISKFTISKKEMPCVLSQTHISFAS